MKKKVLIITLVLAVFFCSGVFAQEWFFGGSAHYTFTMEELGSDTAKRTEFSFRPIIGRVLDKDWDIGTEIELSAVLDYSKTVGIAPFLRYSLATFEKFELLAIFQLGYALTFYDDDAHDKLHSFYAAVIPQMEYRISKSVSCFARMGGAVVEHSRGGISTTTLTKVDLKAFTENLFLGIIFHYEQKKPDPKKATPAPRPAAPQPGVKR